MHSFGSDNHSGISPEILEAIGKANTVHALAYGEDEYTVALEKEIKRHFGQQASKYALRAFSCLFSAGS